MKTDMLTPRKKAASQNDAQQAAELTDIQLDMVVGGINTGFGAGTAFTSGAEGALNVANALVATTSAPAYAPISEDNQSLVASGSITAGAGNPSNFVGHR